MFPRKTRINSSTQGDDWKGFTEHGLTLLEVLVSLVITGIILTMTLNFYISEYRLTKQDLLAAEADYALLRAGQVLTSSVKMAESVSWNTSQLQVFYQQEGKTVKDSFYLADKDWDGIKDLYREHLGVPNPIASGLTYFNCTEIRRGLWKITVKANKGQREVSWERTVGQRVCTD